MFPKISKEYPIAIGIDFGNDYSRVGIYYDKNFVCIPDEIGNVSIPSYVLINEHERVAGYTAKQQAIRKPQKTFNDLKKLAGKTLKENSSKNDLQTNTSSSPYFAFDDNQTPVKLRLQEIIATLFSKLKTLAEQFINESIHSFAVTLPIIFGDTERLVIKDAAIIAGFKKVKFIRESVAAALAYNPSNKDQKKNIFIFDLGGSHLGLSVLAIEEEAFEQIFASEFELSGKDFDRKLMGYCIQDLKKHYQIDLTSNERGLKRLENHCEKAKRDLTFSIQTKFEIENLYDGQDYSCSITRPKFEDLCSTMFQQISSYIDQTLKQSKLKVEQLDQVIVAGGASKIPKITEIISEYFKGIQINNTIDPENLIVQGAAIQAAFDNGHYEITKPWFCCIPELSLIPMGIEVDGGLFHVLIDRNLVYPVKRKHVFTTSQDDQTNVLVNLFEGYCPIAKQNHHLATISLGNIPPAPKGVAKIEVILDIDCNNKLKLIVVDMATGRSNEFSIPLDKIRYEKFDVEKCISDAEAHAIEYAELREKMEASSLLESCCYYMKNTLNNLDHKEKEDNKRICYNKILDWIKDTPTATKEDYQNKLDQVQEVFNKFMEKCHQPEKVFVFARGLPSPDEKSLL